MTDELHPLHTQLIDAVAALPDTPARAALHKTVIRHEPQHWLPERTWITCSECAVLSWPPPEQTDAMWSDVVYPCSTVADIATALGLQVPDWYANTSQATERLEAFVERSHLSTAEVVLLRAAVRDDVAGRLVERAAQAGADERARTDHGQVPATVRTELWHAFAGGRDDTDWSGPDDPRWGAALGRILTHLGTTGMLRTPATPTHEERP